MRIAVLHPSFAIFGGTEKLCFDLYPALVRRGHEVTLFTTDLTPQDAEANLPGVTVIDVGPVEVFGDTRMFAEQDRVGRKLAPLLRGFDVVRMHGIPSPTWWLRACETDPSLTSTRSNWCCHGVMGGLYDDVAAAHVLAARSREPLPVTTYDSAPPSARLKRAISAVARRGMLGAVKRAAWELGGGRQRLVERMLSVQAQAVANLSLIVTDSQFVAEYLTRIWDCRPVCCYPGVVTVDHGPVVDPGDDLVTVCRLQESKNVISVLRAVAQLRAAGPLPFGRYIIGGDGADRDRLMRVANELQLEDVVEFVGTVDNRDLNRYLDQCGVFILPALDESFGVTYLEAGSRARACIGPNHGGPSETVIDGETGWTVEPTDIDALAAAIQEAFGDREELKCRGVAAKHRVETFFSMERFLDCTERACSGVK